MQKALQPYYCQKVFIEQLTKQDDSSLLKTEVESKRRKLTDDWILTILPLGHIFIVMASYR